MIEVNPLVVVLLAEAVAVLAIGLGIWGVLAWRRDGRDKRAIRALVARVRSQKDDRNRAARSVLERAGLGGASLEAAAAEIQRAEQAFLQTFIKTYRERNAASVEDLLSTIDALTAPYRSGNLGSAPARAETESDLEVAPAESLPAEHLAELEFENEKLTEELRITRDTLDNMLKEYASMFASERGDASPSSEAPPASQAADGEPFEESASEPADGPADSPQPARRGSIAAPS